jgi:hypothetical protein
MKTEFMNNREYVDQLEEELRILKNKYDWVKFHADQKREHRVAQDREMGHCSFCDQEISGE